MSSRKYRKFGLRADRSLTDLSSAGISLANLLNNLASDPGVPFVPDDLLVIKGIKSTEIDPIDFIQLNNLVEIYLVPPVPPATGNTVFPIRPVVTIQDQINNASTFIGKPPYIGGGDGFLAEFVPSARVNTNITGTTNGDNLFDRTVTFDEQDPLFGKNIIGPTYFWSNGIFEFGSSLHPSFGDQYGLIQWTGYLSTDYSLSFETSGHILVEEDTLDDGNWTIKKSIYTEDRVLTLPSVANGYSATYDATRDRTLVFYGPEAIYAAEGDVVELGGNEYVVSVVINESQIVYFSGNITGLISPEATLTHSYTLGSDSGIDTGPITFTKIRPEVRTKIRISLWFPIPQPGQFYFNKYMLESQFDDSNDFTEIYSTNFLNQQFSPYSFKTFDDTRARSTNQLATSSATFRGVALIQYDIKKNFSDIAFGQLAVTHENYGKMVTSVNLPSDIKEGVWVVLTSGSNNPLVYQVEYTLDERTFFIKTSAIAEQPDGIALGAQYTATFFRNNGLVGIYNFTGVTSASGRLKQIPGNGTPLIETLTDGSGDSYTIPRINSLFYRVDLSAYSTGSANNALQITDIDDGTTGQLTITATDSLSTSGTITAAQVDSPTRIALVYSDSGLKDLSSAVACEGVLGKESTAIAAAGTSSIQVSDANGIATGYFVQFGNAIPASNNVKVGSIVGNTINLVQSDGVTPFNITGTGVAANVTIIFINPTFDPSGVSKEFCIIPFNTAPPFAGIDTGLETTAANPNLTVDGIKFFELEIENLNVVDIGASTQYAEIIPVTYSGTTYKLLVE